jgi:hypothetical protein
VLHYGLTEREREREREREKQITANEVGTGHRHEMQQQPFLSHSLLHMQLKESETHACLSSIQLDPNERRACPRFACSPTANRLPVVTDDFLQGGREGGREAAGKRQTQDGNN